MNIIQIKKADINDAAKVLALAFCDDPIFRYIFQTTEKYEKSAVWMFSSWVRWAMLYGNAWMTDDKKGVVLMRSLQTPEMSISSMIHAGMLLTPFKLGFTSFRRFYFEIVSLLDKKHKEIMGVQPHWYGWMIGVTSEQRGIGRELMNYCFKIADDSHVPIFLETSTQRNVALYNHKEFQVRDKVQFAPGDFTLYFMVRSPRDHATT
jgi:hypothetical protein